MNLAHEICLYCGEPATDLRFGCCMGCAVKAEARSAPQWRPIQVDSHAPPVAVFAGCPDCLDSGFKFMPHSDEARERCPCRASERAA